MSIICLFFIFHLIGSISEEESKMSISDLQDPYANEPRRNPNFIVNAPKPFNAEPPLPVLMQNYLTPS